MPVWAPFAPAPDSEAVYTQHAKKTQSLRASLTTSHWKHTLAGKARNESAAVLTHRCDGDSGHVDVHSVHVRQRTTPFMITTWTSKREFPATRKGYNARDINITARPYFTMCLASPTREIVCVQLVVNK